MAGPEGVEAISESDVFDWLITLGLEPADDGVTSVGTERAFRHLGSGEILHDE